MQQEPHTLIDTFRALWRPYNKVMDRIYEHHYNSGRVSTAIGSLLLIQDSHTELRSIIIREFLTFFSSGARDETSVLVLLTLLFP